MDILFPGGYILLLTFSLFPLSFVTFLLFYVYSYDSMLDENDVPL
jgi:hypothetical protein